MLYGPNISASAPSGRYKIAYTWLDLTEIPVALAPTSGTSCNTPTCQETVSSDMSGSGVDRRVPNENGATLVEFAVVAPLLFLLLFGVIEFGRAVVTYTAVNTAAREGARYAATVGDSSTTPGTLHYFDCDGIVEAALAKSVLGGFDPDDITITYDSGPETASIADCEGGNQPTVDNVPTGSRIVVRVSTQFESPIPIISNILGTLDVEAQQARTLFKGEIGD